MNRSKSTMITEGKKEMVLEKVTSYLVLKNRGGCCGVMKIESKGHGKVLIRQKQHSRQRRRISGEDGDRGRNHESEF